MDGIDGTHNFGLVCKGEEEESEKKEEIHQTTSRSMEDTLEQIVYAMEAALETLTTFTCRFRRQQ